MLESSLTSQPRMQFPSLINYSTLGCPSETHKVCSPPYLARKRVQAKNFYLLKKLKTNSWLAKSTKGLLYSIWMRTHHIFVHKLKSQNHLVIVQSNKHHYMIFVLNSSHLNVSSTNSRVKTSSVYTLVTKTKWKQWLPNNYYIALIWLLTLSLRILST